MYDSGNLNFPGPSWKLIIHPSYLLNEFICVTFLYSLKYMHRDCCFPWQHTTKSLHDWCNGGLVPLKTNVCTRQLLQSFGHLFLVRLVWFFLSWIWKNITWSLFRHFQNVGIWMCLACRCMDSGSSCFWWRCQHARAEKRWHCSCACILKSKLDWHHEIQLEIKFLVCLRDFCKENYIKILSHGV